MILGDIRTRNEEKAMVNFIKSLMRLKKIKKKDISATIIPENNML